MHFARLGAAVFASTIGVVGATGTLAGAATDKVKEGVPKLSATATASEACDVVFGTDAFEKAPSEGEVSPGEAVSVDVTWGSGWKKGSTVEVVGCTAVDSEFSEELSTRIRKVKNDGLFVHEFTVPKDVAKGALLCERAIVIGLSAAGSPKAERLDADCFTVAGAAAAEAKPAPAEKKEAAGPAAKPATEAKPSTSADKLASAAKAEAAAKAAAAAKPAAAAAKTPVVAGKTETKPAAAAAPAAEPGNLARTGSGDRTLAVGAGLLFVLGGCAVAFGRPLRGALR